MDSPTAQDALRRVTEAEQRIRRLANQVQGSRHGSPAGSTDAHPLTRSPPSQHLDVNGAYARTPHAEAGGEQRDRKYEQLERRVHDLEATVAALREELQSMKRQQQGTVAALQDSGQFSGLVLRSLSEIPKAVSAKSLGSGGSLGEDSIAKHEAVRYVHTTFDLDSDGYLNFQDSARMQEVTEGAALSMQEYEKLCSYFHVEPSRGFDVNDLHRMYSAMEGADLDGDFEKARSFRREQPVASDLRTTSN